MQAGEVVGISSFGIDISSLGDEIVHDSKVILATGVMQRSPKPLEVDLLDWSTLLLHEVLHQVQVAAPRGQVGRMSQDTLPYSMIHLAARVSGV